MQLYQIKFKAMGSPCELLLYCENKTRYEDTLRNVRKEIERLENTYTRFRDTSLTAEINRSAGKCPVSVDLETSKLLEYADALYKQSDGLFDITSGVLRRAWDFKSGRVPTDSDLEPLLELIDWPAVERTEKSVYLPKTEMQIDFGGFVKEYAADVLAIKCLESGIKSGLVNLGGDMRVVGPHPSGSGWKIGIQHPRKVNTAITKLTLFSGGIATSGDYERYMMVENVRYSHLLNPKTGKSIQPAYASTSVIADSCLIAGSCATVAMLKSMEEPNWLDELELPFLTVDQNLSKGGPLA